MGHLLAAAGGCSINASPGRNTGLCTAKGSISLSVHYATIVPFLVLGGSALFVLLLAAVLPKRRYPPGLWAFITVLAGLGTIADGFFQWENVPSGVLPLSMFPMGGQVIYDSMSAFFVILFGAATVLGALIADGYLTRENLDGPEPYVLMITCSLGAIAMATSGNFITLFLGLEILSISLYTMSAYHRRRAASGEAGLKYFILGSFASAIFIYGVALIYGATGSLEYVYVWLFSFYNVEVHNGILLAGMGLMVVGLAFKVAAVPFHSWAPDVYQGAPTPFVGYMAAVAKAAGFAALVRVLMMALVLQVSDWRPIIWVLATASVLIGSVLALVQVDLKRMLAYSSISQAGYVLIALQAGTAGGVTALCFYVFTYTFLVMGTFAIVSVIQGRGEARTDLSAVRGLSSRSPWLAAAMVVLLLGQAGIPLTSGFLGKWVVIAAVIAKGQYELALIGMLGAAIAAFVYLRVAYLMYVPVDAAPVTAQAEADDETLSGSDFRMMATAGLSSRDMALAVRTPPPARLHVPWATSLAVGICVAFTIFAGVSTPMLSFAHSIALAWPIK
jgi:NADH-quinone oxidoreductase subunit N